MRVRFGHRPNKHGEKLWEINGAIAVLVNVVNHLLQVFFGRVLTQAAHYITQLLCCDRAAIVLVKQAEGVLEFCTQKIAGAVRWQLCGAPTSPAAPTHDLLLGDVVGGVRLLIFLLFLRILGLPQQVAHG